MLNESTKFDNIDDSKGEVHDQKRLFSAFFTDGTAFMAQIKVTQKKMFLKSLGKMAAYLTVGTILLILYGYWRAKSIAQKMTKQVVTLYENLNEISQKSKGKQSGQRNVVELKYVPACKEMNDLNLIYNKFAKIISLASTFDEDQNDKALLNYSEAFGIFEDFDD